MFTKAACRPGDMPIPVMDVGTTGSVLRATSSTGSQGWEPVGLLAAWVSDVFDDCERWFANSVQVHRSF
jgi:hypothetical protein